MESVASPENNDVVLQAAGICKSFPGVCALDGVDITVRRGRLNAVLGENGAGKSTLMNILAGVFLTDAGTVKLIGKPVAFRNPREAQSAGISIIFQELNLVPGLSIAENIFIGREPLNRLGLVDYRRTINLCGARRSAGDTAAFSHRDFSSDRWCGTQPTHGKARGVRAGGLE